MACSSRLGENGHCRPDSQPGDECRPECWGPFVVQLATTAVFLGPKRQSMEGALTVTSHLVGAVWECTRSNHFLSVLAYVV